MISLDTSILLYGFVSSSPLHSAALAFISSIAAREDITLSEFILTEFYLHLRNPAVRFNRSLRESHGSFRAPSYPST